MTGTSSAPQTRRDDLAKKRGNARGAKVETIAKVRWGNGFERAVGYMKVFRLRSGEIVAHHRDTRLGVKAATRVPSVENLSGFFGYCPRAVSVYQALGVPVRRAA